MESVFGLDAEQYRAFSKWHSIVAALLVFLLALLWLLGYGPGAFRDCAEEKSPTSELRNSVSESSTPVPAPAAPDATTAAPTPTAPVTPQVATDSAPATPTPPAQIPDGKATAEKANGETDTSSSPALPQSRRPERDKPIGTAPSARVYFARDKYRLPNDASDKLAKIVTYLNGNAAARVQISGYHDRWGQLSYNLELANRRAKEVAKALENAGVSKGQIQLQRPSQTRGSGNPEEARRVELKVVN